MNSIDRKQKEEQPKPRNSEPRDLEFLRMLEAYAADLRAICDKLRDRFNCFPPTSPPRFERRIFQSTENPIGTLSSVRHFRDMPRYYFNVHNVSPSAGDLGEELPDNDLLGNAPRSSLGRPYSKTTACFGPVENGR
jgi:hypothetical protein